MLQAASTQGPQPFRFHILETPESFDPAKARSTISSYLLNSLYQPLLRWSDGKLVPAGARSCAFVNSRHVHCDLDKSWRWSDGALVKSSELVAGLRALFVEKSTRAESFLQLKGAHELLAAVNAKTLANLGVKASSGAVDFFLESDDGDFLYRLIDTALTPRRDFALDGRVTAGPYIVSKVTPGRSIYLKSNSYFKPERPDIEIMIVEDDDTALRLFQKKELNFLRRLTTENIAKYEKTPEYFVQPLLRFDYVGFTPKLATDENVRSRLINAINSISAEFEVIVHSPRAKVNCLGLRSELTGGDVCYGQLKFEAKDANEKLFLGFASGSDDVRREMELFQNAWKKAGLKVDLSSFDVHVLENMMRKEDSAPTSPSLFRRGVNLDRPTCLAAVELFESTNRNNLIHYNEPEYDKKVQALRAGRDEPSRVKLCRDVTQFLLNAERIIPLGRLEYAMLRDDKFDGYTLNELSQIDVTKLHRR